jgi:predicted O-methyltransferase YrrM
LVSGADPGARIVSIERDPARAAAVADLCRDRPAVQVRTGDWHDLADTAPFDLLVLDGGGQGKGDDPPLDPTVWLRPGGLLVMDDFSPSTVWPPQHGGGVDAVRVHWLAHPNLRATQVNVTPKSATILATYFADPAGCA